MAIQPKLTQNRLNLAGCLIEVKALPRAEALLKKIIDDYPRFPLAQFNLGLLYDEQRRVEEARAAYAAEVTAYPGHFKARFNLGRVLFQLGQDAAAVDEMREVVRLTPRLPQGYLFLARGLLKTGAPIDEVQALVEKGLFPRRDDGHEGPGLPVARRRLNRRQQPEKMNEALRRADSYVPARNPGARHDIPRPVRQLGIAVTLLAMLVLAASGLAQYREYYVRGRVLDAQKKPLPDVEIALLDASTSRRFHMKTDQKGEFKFAGLPHATYEVTFAREGFVTGKDKWEFGAPQDRMQRVEIPDVVLASQSQVQEVQRFEVAKAGCRGGGGEAPAGRSRRRDLRL